MNLTETGNAQMSGGTHAGQGVFGMLRVRQGIPGWADDTVWRQVKHQWKGRHNRSGMPPWTDIGRQEEGAGGFRSKLHKNKWGDLGPDCSLSKVVISSPRYLDIPHVLVVSNTNTHLL